jgi:hypothetical protein
MPKYEVQHPMPQHISHRVKVPRDEVIEALRDYAIKNGISLPDGEWGVWGVERNAFDGEQSLTLTVSAPAD